MVLTIYGYQYKQHTHSSIMYFPIFLTAASTVCFLRSSNFSCVNSQFLYWDVCSNSCFMVYYYYYYYYYYYCPSFYRSYWIWCFYWVLFGLRTEKKKAKTTTVKEKKSLKSAPNWILVN